MWALVESGSVQRAFNRPRSITIDGILHPAGIFGAGWTDDERKAIGIYNYVEVNSLYDNRFYTLGSRAEDIDASAGLVTVTYTNVAKAIDDNGKSGDEYVAGVKTNMITAAKQQSNSRLESTDWQVIAKTERSRAIDSDVATYRAAVVSAYGEIKTLINNQNTVAKIAALYNPPLDSDGNPRKDSDGNVITKHDINKWPDSL